MVDLREAFGSSAYESGETPVTTPDQAMRVNAVYRAVAFKARQAASLPWRVFDTDPATGQRTGRRRQNDWVYRLLALRPNAFQGPYEFWTQMIVQLELTGAAYAQIQRNVGRTEVLALMPLPTRKVTPKILSDTEIVYEVAQDTGAPITLRQDQMLHIRGLHSDILHAISPIAAQKLGLEAGLALQTHRHSTFSKWGVSASGVLQQEGTVDLSSETTQRWLKLFQRQARGPKVSGGVPVVPKGFAFKADGVSLQDLQYIDSEKLTAREIFGIFSVWPSLLGEEADAKYSTATAGAGFFVKFSLRTLLTQIEQAVCRDVLGPNMQLTTDAVMDASELLRGDNEAQARVHTQLVTAGIESRNEARLALGMMASNQDGADDLTAQSQNIPLAGAAPAEPDDEAPPDDPEADDVAAAAVLRLAREGF